MYPSVRTYRQDRRKSDTFLSTTLANETREAMRAKSNSYRLCDKGIHVTEGRFNGHEFKLLPIFQKTASILKLHCRYVAM